MAPSKKLRSLAAKIRNRLWPRRRAALAGRGLDPAADAELDRHLIKDVGGVQAALVRFDGATYFVPTFAADRPVARKILRKRYVSPGVHKLVAQVMKQRPGSIVHAGAFFGDMLPSFSKKTTGRVYAFEPVLEHFVLADKVVRANKLSNVTLLHAGLSAAPSVGHVRTQRKQRHIGGAAALVRGEVKEEYAAQDVAVMSIDALAIQGLSIIQLDVEGWELEVLQGGVETIRAQRPVIIVEDLPGKCGEFLSDLGYAEVAKVGMDHVYMTADAKETFAALITELNRR